MHAEPERLSPAGSNLATSRSRGHMTTGPRRRAAGPIVRVLLGVLIAASASAGASGCDRGPSAPTATTATRILPSPSTPPAPTDSCLVGRWNVSAEEEFVQMGLDRLTDGAVKATSGTIVVTFAADHTYTFSYDKVRLSVGGGAGSAAVDGPVTGTWKLAGDRLTTTVGSSKIEVNVKVAGVTVTPAQSLNDALKNGMPGAARVSCTPDRLVTTVTTGAATGQQVTFGRG